MKLLAAAIALFALAACDGAPPPPTLAALVAESARASDVPEALVLAVAAVEGGLRLPRHREVDADDHVPVAGILELRHGALDTLALGARLAGTTEAALRADTDLGTRAGVLVLAHLGARSGARPGDLPSWRPALVALSGLRGPAADAYADDVLEILRNGAELATPGERLRIAPHAELPARLPPKPELRAAGTPDFPGAEWFDTSCTGKCTPGRPDGNASVDTIVIHDTEGGWIASVATLQNDPGKSVHYIIDADGVRVGQFRPETDTTWHAGNFFYNKHSVGIEHVGVASDPAGYAPALYAKSRDLVQSIRTRWQVPLDRRHIIGHYQIPNGDNIAESSPACPDRLGACETSASYGGAGNHRDPGYYWQWCQYMELLGGSCTCNDAYELWNCTTDRTEAVRCADGMNVEIAHCPGGCEVMPVGTPDVCHSQGAAGAGGNGGAGNGGAGNGGAGNGGAGNGGVGGHAGAGGGAGAGGHAGAGGTSGGSGAGGASGGGGAGGTAGAPAAKPADGGCSTAHPGHLGPWPLVLLAALRARRRVR